MTDDLVSLPVRMIPESPIEKRFQEARATGTGMRFDAGKARMDLLCPIAMEGCAMVLAFGAKKYAEWNWAKGMPWSKVIGSLLRHTFKFMSGEDLDPESGLPHVDHLLCNAVFLSNYYRRHKMLDDRYKSAVK